MCTLTNLIFKKMLHNLPKVTSPLLTEVRLTSMSDSYIHTLNYYLIMFLDLYVDLCASRILYYYCSFTEYLVSGSLSVEI